MATIQRIALVFTIIGAIVWGIYGIFDMNIISAIFGESSFIPRLIYIIVGICGLINLGLLFSDIDDK